MQGVTVENQLLFTPGTKILNDRGYSDFQPFPTWIETKVFFLAPQKENARLEVVVEEWELPKPCRILSNQIIRLTIWLWTFHC